MLLLNGGAKKTVGVQDALAGGAVFFAELLKE